MRVLILNPPDENTIIENPDHEGNEFLEADDYGDFPPLGALYVLSHLEAKSTGHTLFFKDCIGERMDYAALASYIKEVAPDVVGIASFTVCLVDVLKAAKLTRELFPNVHLCLGGHHPTAYPHEATELKYFDSIVVGEGEIAFTELVGALEKGEPFTDILGVYTKESIQKYKSAPVHDRRFLAKITVPVAYVEDIDTLPMLNREYIKHITYGNILGATSDLATLLRSRGCPFKCTFCDIPFKKYRPRSAVNVVDEIEACLAMGYREFRFYDDLFNITPEQVFEFCDEVDKRGLKIQWDFRGRVNTLTRDSLVRAKKSGLRMVSFGVETGSDAGLKLLKKGAKTENMRNAFQWCRELGIISVADFIIGLPHETCEEDVKNNINFLLELDPDYAQINVLKLYPNTEMYDQAVEQGVVEAGRWNKFAKNPHKDFIIDHWEKHLDLATMVTLQKWAYNKFYFRPRYILRSLLKTRSLYELAAKAGGALKLIKRGA
jgi:anaerobic magnesium-protoporphyrin IX monomethyl ester cyclase